MTEDCSQPPKATRFKQGQSGNPKGRPKKRKPKERGSAFEVILDKTVTVTQGGRPRELTVDEALQLQTYQEALAGKASARREVLKMIKRREDWLAKTQPGYEPPPFEIRSETRDPDTADAAMLLLGIASRDPARQDIKADREQLLLEPWAVQAALSRRRGGAALEPREISEIQRCTRDPDRLTWPRSVT